MLRNRKLTKVIKGRTVRRARSDPGKLIIVLNDGSTMTIKTTRIATAIAPGVKIKAVLEHGSECVLQFEGDSASVTLQLADPGASVMVRDGNNAVEYLG